MVTLEENTVEALSAGPGPDKARSATAADLPVGPRRLAYDIAKKRRRLTRHLVRRAIAWPIRAPVSLAYDIVPKADPPSRRERPAGPDIERELLRPHRPRRRACRRGDTWPTHRTIVGNITPDPELRFTTPAAHGQLRGGRDRRWRTAKRRVEAGLFFTSSLGRHGRERAGSLTKGHPVMSPVARARILLAHQGEKRSSRVIAYEVGPSCAGQRHDPRTSAPAAARGGGCGGRRGRGGGAGGGGAPAATNEDPVPAYATTRIPSDGNSAPHEDRDTPGSRRRGQVLATRASIHRYRDVTCAPVMSDRARSAPAVTGTPPSRSGRSPGLRTPGIALLPSHARPTARTRRATAGPGPPMARRPVPRPAASGDEAGDDVVLDDVDEAVVEERSTREGILAPTSTASGEGTSSTRRATPDNFLVPRALAMKAASGRRDRRLDAGSARQGHRPNRLPRGYRHEARARPHAVTAVPARMGGVRLDHAAASSMRSAQTGIELDLLTRRMDSPSSRASTRPVRLHPGGFPVNVDVRRR